MKKITIDKEKFSISKLKELWGDKRGRAKIELAGYLIFFVFVIIFAKAFGSTSNVNIKNDIEEYSFINDISDNYEYNMDVKVNDDLYSYHGKVLGNNSNIIRKHNDEENGFYFMNNKYYELDNNGNYILTTTQDVYPTIGFIYLKMENIKNFINNSIKEEDGYKIKISDIVLNSDNNNSVVIKVDEENKTIFIDYTELLKIEDNSIESVSVNIKIDNINNILSLEE